MIPPLKGPRGHSRQPKNCALNESATKVSPRQGGAGSPFEGGVAGTIDYLIFTKFFTRPGWLIKLILTDTSYGYIIKYKGLRTRIISLDYEA